MLDVLAFLAFGGILYYLGRKSAPKPEPVQVPQDVSGPGSVITFMGKDMVLTHIEANNQVGRDDRQYQSINISFVDMDTYADRHQIPEGF